MKSILLEVDKFLFSDITVQFWIEKRKLEELGFFGLVFLVGFFVCLFVCFFLTKKKITSSSLENSFVHNCPCLWRAAASFLL